MRRLLSALMVLASGWAGAQNNIVGYEHWLDELDSDAERTFVPVTPGASISLNAISIAVDQLSPGLHRVNFRLRDSDGTWSTVLRRSYYVASGASVSLTAGEYWFDQQDQSRVAFTFAAAENIDITVDPVASGLALGMHRIHYRIQDSEGQWSAVLTRTVHLQSNDQVNLTVLRYWSDDSSSQPDDMTTMAIEPAVAIWDVIDEVEFCTWEETGNTNVYFQLKDNQGQWSSVIKRTFDIDLVATGPDAIGAISGPIVVPPNGTVSYSVPVVIGASTYTWDYPEGWVVVGGSAGNSITFETPDDFLDGQVTVTASNACGNSGPAVLDITLDDTGLNASASGGLRIFPNPSQGQFSLLMGGAVPTDRITIMSMTGQTVLDIKVPQSDRLVLDLSSEANGLYTVRVWQGDEPTDLRVMVQH